MSEKYKQENIDSLVLDAKNPRHVGQSYSEIDAIHFLIQTEKVIELAKDIAESGMLVASESLSVLEKNKQKIVVDGNRRLAALKILFNPDLCPPNKKNTINKIINTFPPDEELKNVNVYYCESNEDAEFIKKRKHHGGGVYSRDWSEPAKSKVDDSHLDNLAHSLLALGINKKYISENDDIPPSSLTRYIGMASIKELLGLQNQNTSTRQITTNISEETFHALLKELLTYLTEKPSNGLAHSRQKKEHIDAYVEKLKQKHPNIEAGNIKVIPIDGTQSFSPPITPPPLEPPPPKTSKKLVRKKFPNYSDNQFETILGELKKIPYANYQFATAITFRVFFEKIIRKYYKDIMGVSHIDGKNNEKKNHQILTAIISDLDKKSLTDEQRTALKSLKKISSDTNSIISFDTLGSIAHGSITPDASSIKANWESIESIIEYMVMEIKTSGHS